ncbi:anti-sigma F factor [Candidatus Desulforudis audaxviator]|uniref:Anti-sigma F factor n=1 Tax=Desulforudis audaxviator (strain MP104C) TaxID=477974 RepID=B1I3W9_DESAP|nr:anti-sigma F factor [Candidatus Desulforudis audaxviator]ACA59736.1 putative anti-sigma regulatory factor, serine/threonine protein kinase [Candidatus Desulforudis audaxviator MP104C]AZK59730.1 Anti-sigma F factor [Candidatus Desulforudis audaxviator]
MDYHNFLRVEFYSLPVNVGLARVTVAAFAAQLNYTVSELDDIKGAVSEAVSNAIIHGYEGAPDRLVKLIAVVRGNELEISVEDGGKGIENLEEALRPGYSSGVERLGLGFSFIRSFMDTLDVQTVPGRGTKVLMTKRAGPPGGHAHAN